MHDGRPSSPAIGAGAKEQATMDNVMLMARYAGPMDWAVLGVLALMGVAVALWTKAEWAWAMGGGEQ